MEGGRCQGERARHDMPITCGATYAMEGGDIQTLILNDASLHYKAQNNSENMHDEHYLLIK